MTNDKDYKPVDDLIRYGADLLGTLPGAVLGAWAGGPTGALLGTVGGISLKHALCNIGNEISNRYLGRRERMRIGATYAFAIEKINENIENGQQIRQDTFFQENPGERSIAEEILEGILLAAQREHEEKKLQFYGNLLANIAFHPEIDRSQANFLARLGKNISYRQMCILAIFIRRDEFNLRSEYYEDDYKADEISPDMFALLQEILDLYAKGMLFCQEYMNITLSMHILPAKMAVVGIGLTLHNLMELSRLDDKEVMPTVELLN